MSGKIIIYVYGMKMDEYMEFELSGVFQLKLKAKSIVLGSTGTHFMHTRVKVRQILRIH